jgi:hypothetical protein
VRGVGVSPDGHRLLITSNQGPWVLVLALPSGDVLGWIPLCDMPNFVVFRRDSRIAMVSCSLADRVAVVDLVDLRLLHQVEVGSFPEEMAVFPEQAE